MGHFYINISLTYLIGLEVLEIDEKDIKKPSVSSEGFSYSD